MFNIIIIPGNDYALIPTNGPPAVQAFRSDTGLSDGVENWKPTESSKPNIGTQTPFHGSTSTPTLAPTDLMNGNTLKPIESSRPNIAITPTPTPSDLLAGDNERMLAKHNEYRARHRAPALVLDTEVRMSFTLITFP